MTTKTQPVRIAALVTNFLAVGSVLGLWNLPSAHITILANGADVLIPWILSAAITVYIWLKTAWLHARVSPEATTRPMAEALKTITVASPETVPLAAKEAAERVLGAPGK